jgi:hypothetical protein
MRRRPIGAVLVEICNDLGIVRSHPQWREIEVAILRHGGNLSRLVIDMLKRLSVLNFFPPDTPLIGPMRCAWASSRPPVAAGAGPP